MWPRLVFVYFKDPDEFSDKLEIGWQTNSLASPIRPFQGTLVAKNCMCTKRASSDLSLCITTFLQKTASILSRKSMEVEGTTKEDVMIDDVVLVKFFGSVEKGRDILDILTESQWQYYSLCLNFTTANRCLPFFPYDKGANIYSSTVSWPVIWMLKITIVRSTPKYLLPDI